MSSVTLTRVERPNLRCPFCGTRGVKEVNDPSKAIPGVISALRFFECDRCGQQFYDSAMIIGFYIGVRNKLGQ